VKTHEGNANRSQVITVIYKLIIATMENPNQAKGIQDEIILLSEETDRNYWANRLGVSSEALKSAVRATRCITLHQITAYLSQQKKNLSVPNS